MIEKASVEDRISIGYHYYINTTLICSFANANCAQKRFLAVRFAKITYDDYIFP